MKNQIPLLTIETEQETDGRWIAAVSQLPGVMTYGATVEEAVQSVKKLAAAVIADRVAHNEDAF